MCSCNIVGLISTILYNQGSIFDSKMRIYTFFYKRYMKIYLLLHYNDWKTLINAKLYNWQRF